MGLISSVLWEVLSYTGFRLLQLETKTADFSAHQFLFGMIPMEACEVALWRRSIRHYPC